MALSARQQAIWWGTAAAVFFLLLWYLGDVLMPFILGGAIAYVLDPVADRLERLGLGRTAATAIIATVGFLAFLLIGLLIIPALVAQGTELVRLAPQLVTQAHAFLTERFPAILDETSASRRALETLGQTIQSRGGALIDTILVSAMSLLNIVMLLLVVPVVTVYLVHDWDHLVAAIDDLLPRQHAPVIRQLAAEIDAAIAAFIRGMGSVCLILGTYYAVALMLTGLQFGLVVGFLAGALTFIPYLGAIFGGALAIGLALFQFWGDWLSIGIVAAIFALGQFAEGNFLTPRLVGSSVGLHPVWLLLALSVFGSLFGFVGMLVAVPLAASIGVLARFAVAQYRRSLLFGGPGEAASPAGNRAESGR